LLVRFQNAEEVGPSARAAVDRHLWAEKAVCPRAPHRPVNLPRCAA
jgi:hypothetical protein